MAYLGLLNPLDTAQTVTVELFPEGGRAVSFDVTLAAKSRKGVGLDEHLPPNAAFGTLVHFGRQGVASLTLRNLADFFGPSTQMIAGQMFCRMEEPR